MAYMHDQLSGFHPEGDDTVYETVFLRATRTDRSTRQHTEVDVFDMRWTDLSRVATAGLRMIGELYQLLFYVSGLGRKTLDFAQAQYGNDVAWQALGVCQKYAERLLVLFIPVLNLCALGLGVVLIPQILYKLWGTPALSIATGLILALLAFGALFLIARNKPGRVWPWYFWILLPITVVVGFILPDAIPSHMPLVLALLCWFLISAGIVALMLAYERRRPGAKATAIFGVVLVAAMLVCPEVNNDVGIVNLQDLGLRAGKWLFTLLQWLWATFIALTVATTVLSWIAVRRVPEISDGKLDEDQQERAHVEERSRAKRAAWTANLSLTLPGFVVLLLNLALWRAYLEMVKKIGFIETGTIDQVERLIKDSTPWSFAILLVLAGIALLSVAWSVLPSIAGEVSPYKVGKLCPQQLGIGLSSGFKSMRVAGELIRWIVVLGIPATYLLAKYYVSYETVEKLSDLSYMVTVWVGLALAAMVMGSGPFRALGLGLRTVIARKS